MLVPEPKAFSFVLLDVIKCAIGDSASESVSRRSGRAAGCIAGGEARASIKFSTSKEYNEEKCVAADQGFLQPVPVTAALNFGRFNANPRGRFYL
jgi:hypothetical protein